MNDRFKFRAYNTESKRIYDVRELGFMRDTLELVDICLEKPNNDAYGIEIESVEEYILMQCTGLKDKNGKLIFEGDILQDGVGNTFEIAFIKYCNYIRETKRHYWLKFDERHTSYEIIGNIYENPELLET
ncbi:MAG: YopX family protein [Candidatus Gastranaerophilales bacterium]|nr:YopX family protein [Candidatus Gastranaerophilales bacterium]